MRGCDITAMEPVARGRPGAGPANREGAVLVAVLILVTLLGVFAVTMIENGEYAGIETSKDIGSANAFWTAEAGIEHAEAIAQKIRKPFGDANYSAYTGCFFGSNVLNGVTSRGSYTVSVVDDPAWTNAVQALKKYVIVARGIVAVGGTACTNTIAVHAAIQTFASYSHSSNFERDRNGNRLYFTSDDVLDGPVYVNDRLNILGTPRFLQFVNSAGGTPYYTGGGTVSVFEGGYNFNATPISNQFSGAIVTDIKNQAQQPGGGLILTNDYRFVFLTNGMFTYQRTTNNARVYTNSLSALTNGAIYVNGTATVSGVVNGRVTLAAQRSILITNDIVYASAMNPNPWMTNTFNIANVDDYLGLIASNSVVLMMRTNVNLHAAIMVTSGASSGLEGFSAYWNGSDLRVGGVRPAINFFGSLSQYRRGLIWSSGSDNGFRKIYKFDQRFVNDAPPSFPYSVYVFTGWSSSGY